MKRQILGSLLVVLAAVAASGCRDAPLAENVDTNWAPIAHAGANQMLDYTGAPVTVRLDGSGSNDPDGTIAAYRWFSGNDAPDGGLGRGGIDPDDVMSPEVTLDAGTWIFTLFVIDDGGDVSQPSTVMIKVGSDFSPEAMECSAMALQTIAEECRLCMCDVDAECRTAVMGCQQDCWDFYTCVQNSCGEFVNDMTALADCVRANCTAFFAGVGDYMPLERCARSERCASTCSESVQGM